MSFWVILTFWFWTRREILDYCDIWNIWPSKSYLWHLNYSSNHQCSYIYLYVYLCWEVLRKCTEFNASCQEVRTPASFVSLYRWFGPTVSKTGERPVVPMCRSFQRKAWKWEFIYICTRVTTWTQTPTVQARARVVESISINRCLYLHRQREGSGCFLGIFKG